MGDQLFEDAEVSRNYQDYRPNYIGLGLEKEVASFMGITRTLPQVWMFLYKVYSLGFFLFILRFEIEINPPIISVAWSAEDKMWLDQKLKHNEHNSAH